MIQTSALQWEMFGPGTAVEFFALRDEAGYGLRVRCGGEMLMEDVVPDGSTLLRKSSELRAQLAKLGFAGKPAKPGSSELSGGVCWGPAPVQGCVAQLAG